MKRSRISDYFELTKPRVTTLVLLTTAVGYYMRSGLGFGDGIALVHTLIGTALVAGGASAVNQYMERHRDARMLRTRERPLPGGRLSEAEAMLFSWATSLAGVLYLLMFTRGLTAGLAALTVLMYVFIYTPLKTRTGWATLVGAIPGAAPPILGWTAAGGSLDAMAAALFAIIFLWQMPHFLAIAWLYDEDYVRGGFSHLTVRSNGQRSTSRQIILYCCGLLPVSLIPTVLGTTGMVYLTGALLAGLIYLAYGFGVAVYRSPVAARKLLRASVLYLPAIFLLMVIDRLGVPQ